VRFTRGVMFAFSRNRLVGWYLRLIAAPSACWISRLLDIVPGGSTVYA